MLNFISTPIGNLNDISLRAIDVINSSDILYAEDTRNTRKLLDHIKIKKKCYSFHEHNEDKVIPDILINLKNNINISILSDAGTPAISDPGYKLIQKCIKEDINFTLIPGPTAVISSLIMSGLPTNKFTFNGFFPRKKNEKDKCLLELSNEEKTSIFFESSKRIEATLEALMNYFDDDRKIVLCKELTKIHENVLRGNAKTILKEIQDKNLSLKGEFAILIGGTKKKNLNTTIDKRIKDEFLKKLSASDSAKLISLITGKNKRDIYKIFID